MFKIEAIIHPFRLEPVREALEDIDVVGLTAIDCRGTGRQHGATHSFRGSHYSNSLIPHVLVQVVVTSEHLDNAVDAIQQAGHTGEIGDGMIFVYEVHEAVRIRTNERGETALG